MKILALLLLSSLAIPAQTNDSAITGVWRGNSICASEASSCRNETVVYYIKNVPDKPSVMFVKADKLVEGKPVTMGAGEWEYDRASRTLMLRSEQRSWRLKLDGTQIEGMLTLANNTVFRRMTLKKDE
jgi:hypothetical protein